MTQAAPVDRRFESDSAWAIWRAGLGWLRFSDPPPDNKQLNEWGNAAISDPSLQPKLPAVRWSVVKSKVRSGYRGSLSEGRSPHYAVYEAFITGGHAAGLVVIGLESWGSRYAEASVSSSPGKVYKVRFSDHSEHSAFHEAGHQKEFVVDRDYDGDPTDEVVQAIRDAEGYLRQ